MAVRKSVFDGFHERQLFRHLQSIWQHRFNIYPQLPFAKVFELKNLDLTAPERDYLLKTNIDYTICTKEDTPLLCIEFDGWSHGYSRGAEYVQVVEDPLRKLKLESKLRVAAQHTFPYYIVSYDEKMEISEGLHLTILDGVIGQTIAKLRFPEKIREYLSEVRDALPNASPDEWHEYVQDLAIQAEVELELQWDPIARRATEIEGLLFRKGLLLGYESRFLARPGLPDFQGFHDIEGLKKRLLAWRNIRWHGCEIVCKTPTGPISERAWVRNFHGLASPLTIAENVAQLLAFYKVARRFDIAVP